MYNSKSLYTSTNGDTWVTSTNWQTTEPMNNWYGINTQDFSGENRVIEIDLHNNNLTGSLPDLSNLTELKRLKLHINAITGGLNPAFLPTSLEEIEITENTFTGALPDVSGFTNLTKFLVGQNQFDGSLEMAKVPITLTHLFVNNNNLIGTFPSFSSLMTTLQQLSLSNNQFTGTLDLSMFDATTPLNTFYVAGTPINSLQLGNRLDLNIKNTPNLGCVEVPTTSLSHYYNLSMDNFDLGVKITDNCSGISNLDSTERNVLKAIYDTTNGDAWSYRTYASTVITTGTSTADVRGFETTEFSGTRKITKLYFSGMNLNGALPPEIDDFRELTELNLSSNSINNLPTEIGNLSKLTHLNLNRNRGITTMTAIVGNLTELISFTFNNTQVDLLPTTIGNLTKLKILEFGSTKITLLPPEIGNLTELTRLVAAPNNIASIPTEFGQLSKLTYLDFASCQLSNTPAAFASLTELETLYLNNNQLQVVAGLGGFTKLKHLRLHNNRLGEDNPNFNTDLPEDMSDLVLLEELTLYNNQLTKLPTNIGNLIKLTSLKLNNNALRNLPASIGNLTSLDKLELQQNALTSLPASIGDLTSLLELRLEGNELTSLPVEIGGLISLEKLYLSTPSYSNKIANLPEEIGDLTKLKELFIEYMRSHENGVYTYYLNSLPTTMNTLTSLEVLQANNNEIGGLVDLTNLLKLTRLQLQSNKISDLKIDAPTSNFYYISSPSYYFNVSDNPFISCIEVPTIEISNWDARYLQRPTIADNGIAFSDNCTGFKVPQTEREALIAFYIATKGGKKVDVATGITWTGINWSIDATELTNVGSWEGVTTEIIDGQKHVTRLELASKRLSGNIPKEIEDLSELKKIDLSSGSIRTVATEIGGLSKLTYLNLSSNSLESLPAGIGNLTSLIELNLKIQRKEVNTYYNYISTLTSLPEEIGNIATLEKLDISSNGLTSLPSGIGNFSNLKELKGNNQDTRPGGIQTLTLTSLPVEIGNITSLEKLELQQNALISLPNTITNLDKLEVLNISNNRISTALDLSKSEVLRDFRMEYNDIPNLKLNVAPTIFGTYAQSPRSNRFHAKRNALGCIEVPSDELVSWQLSFYKEEGGIIDNGVVYSDNCNAVTTNSISDLEREALISLYNNTTGTSWKNDLSSSYNGVPWEIDNTLKRNVGAWFGVTTAIIAGQKHVTKVTLNSNDLDGVIPSGIKNLSQLKELKFNRNGVSEIASEIGELANLEQLTFSSQYKDSEYVLKAIPAEINNITSLKRLDISSNKLEGNLDFSNLIYLNALSVSSNEITGLKIGVTPAIFDGQYDSENQYSKSFSFSSNSYLNCIAVPKNTITDWAASSFATSYPSIVWGQDCSAYNNVPETEIQALVDMYNNLDGANWTTNTNWTGALARVTINSPYNATKWSGVTTKIVDGGKHITDIRLNSNKLKGAFSTSFGNLTKLKYLQVSSNEISGSVPNSFGNLTVLEEIYLNNNKLTNLPTSFKNLVKLKRAYFQTNELSGDLPDFSGISTLETLYISKNKFQFGDFEDEFSSYQSLTNSWNYSGYYNNQAKVGAEQTITIGNPTTLKAVVNGVNNVYQWYKNHSPISGATDKGYTIETPSVLDNGVYYCNITNSVITGLTIQTENITITYDAALNIDSEQNVLSFKVYPNPTQGFITIEMPSSRTIKKMTLFNVLGKKVFSSDSKKRLDLRTFVSGIYLLRIDTDKGVISQRVIKK